MIKLYQERISGSLLDRIDNHLDVPRVDFEKRSDDQLEDRSELIRARVEAARAYHRVLKRARTIADPARENGIAVAHVAEFVQYRPGRRGRSACIPAPGPKAVLDRLFQPLGRTLSVVQKQGTGQVVLSCSTQSPSGSFSPARMGTFTRFSNGVSGQQYRFFSKLSFCVGGYNSRGSRTAPAGRCNARSGAAIKPSHWKDRPDWLKEGAVQCSSLQSGLLDQGASHPKTYSYAIVPPRLPELAWTEAVRVSPS